MERIQYSELSERLTSRKGNVVGFYIDRIWGGGQDIWMDDLASFLRGRGYVTVAIATSKSAQACGFREVDFFTVADGAQLEALEGLDAILTSDVESAVRLPQDARVLATSHRMWYDYCDHFQCVPVMRWADAYITHGPISPVFAESFRDFWTGCIGPAQQLRNRRDFHIIPCGYPSLKYEIDRLRENGAKPDSLVYAPIYSPHFFTASGDRIKSYGIELVRRLLANFPAYKVIFRPDPKDLENPAVVELAAHFGKEPRFSMDCHKSRTATFASGALLITDYSNIFKTFSYSTLRSAVYFQTHFGEPGWRKFDCGYLASNLDALIKGVGECLDNSAAETERLGKYRDSILMPPEDSYLHIETAIRTLLAGKSDPGWVEIDRNPDLAQNECEFIGKIDRSLAAVRTQTARNACLYRDPQSPLLAAYALHTGKALSPKAPTCHFVLQRASAMLGYNLPRLSNAQSSPTAIHRLYWQAFSAYHSRGETGACKLIAEKLAELQTIAPLRRISVSEDAALDHETTIAVGLIPASGRQPAGFTFYLNNTDGISTCALTVAEYNGETAELDLGAMAKVYERRFNREELYLYSNEQDVFFETSGLCLSRGKLYLVALESDAPLKPGLSYSHFTEAEVFFRGWHSNGGASLLVPLPGLDALACGVHYVMD